MDRIQIGDGIVELKNDLAQMTPNHLPNPVNPFNSDFMKLLFSKGKEVL